MLWTSLLLSSFGSLWWIRTTVWDIQSVLPYRLANRLNLYFVYVWFSFVKIAGNKKGALGRLSDQNISFFVTQAHALQLFVAIVVCLVSKWRRCSWFSSLISFLVVYQCFFVFASPFFNFFCWPRFGRLVAVCCRRRLWWQIKAEQWLKKCIDRYTYVFDLNNCG